MKNNSELRDLTECRARKRIMIDKLRKYHEVCWKHDIYTIQELDGLLSSLQVENKELKHEVDLLSKFILSKGYTLDDFNEFIVKGGVEKKMREDKYEVRLIRTPDARVKQRYIINTAPFRILNFMEDKKLADRVCAELNMLHSDNMELQNQLDDCYSYINQLEESLEKLGVPVK